MKHQATYDPNTRGGWSVPVGAIMADEYRPCHVCGTDVNVLTVATQDGPEVLAADVEDWADEDNTRCRNCKDA